MPSASETGDRASLILSILWTLHSKHHGPHAVMQPDFPQPTHLTSGRRAFPGCFGSRYGLSTIISSFLLRGVTHYPENGAWSRQTFHKKPFGINRLAVRARPPHTTFLAHKHLISFNFIFDVTRRYTFPWPDVTHWRFSRPQKWPVWPGWPSRYRASLPSNLSIQTMRRVPIRWRRCSPSALQAIF